MTASRVLRWQRGTGRRQISIDRTSPRTPIRTLTIARRRHRSGPAGTSPRCATSRSPPGCRRARCRGSSTTSRRACRSPRRPASGCSSRRAPLGYRPNPLARGLRGASTMLIGRGRPRLQRPVLRRRHRGAGRRVRWGTATTSCWARHGRLDEAMSLTTVLETRHTDAIVLLGDMQDQPRLLEDLRHSIVPVVALWQGTSPLGVPDRRRRRPGRHPGRPGAPGRARPHADRVRQRPAAGRQPAAPRRVHRVHGRALRRRPPPTTSRTCRTRWPAARRRCDALLELDDPPTALVTSTDLVAIGVLHAAYSRGRDRPARAVGGRLRRHPHRGPHGAGADHAADADHRDGPRGRPPGRRIRAGPDRAARGAHPVVRPDARRPRVHGAAARSSSRRPPRTGPRPA